MSMDGWMLSLIGIHPLHCNGHSYVTKQDFPFSQPVYFHINSAYIWRRKVLRPPWNNMGRCGDQAWVCICMRWISYGWNACIRFRMYGFSRLTLFENLLLGALMKLQSLWFEGRLSYFFPLNKQEDTYHFFLENSYIHSLIDLMKEALGLRSEDPDFSRPSYPRGVASTSTVVSLCTSGRVEFYVLQVYLHPQRLKPSSATGSMSSLSCYAPNFDEMHVSRYWVEANSRDLGGPVKQCFL